MSKFGILLLLFSISFSAISQQVDSLTTFFYSNGKKSSEGFLFKGKPNGYWKTFYETGQLKSDGNRQNYLLDSVWSFYAETGDTTFIVNYKFGKKNGIRTTFLSNEIIKENFKDDIKYGLTKRYDTNYRLLQTTPFINGLEDGISFCYDTLGNLNEIFTYEKGFLVKRERLNRFDSDGRRHGQWKTFFENGTVETEIMYKHGLKHGFLKIYDKSGNLKNIEKYVDGILQENAEELARLEIRRDYHPNGKIKIEATYLNQIPEGIRREFDTLGTIERAFIFKKGIIIGEGIITENGQRQGVWSEFYPDGKLKGEGNYKDDKRTGEWIFYYQNGVLEQKGKFDTQGKPVDEWRWYYDDGKLLREESYFKGLKEGLMTEYDPNGNIVVQGEYLNDLEEGKWTFNSGDMRAEGEYADGLRNGYWKEFYKDGQVAFEGKFIDDNPDGKHKYFYPNGTVREEGEYVMGRKHGNWYKYQNDGLLILSITYKNGVETKYDGVSIEEDEIVE